MIENFLQTTGFLHHMSDDRDTGGLLLSLCHPIVLVVLGTSGIGKKSDGIGKQLFGCGDTLENRRMQVIIITITMIEKTSLARIFQ
jgi:hypothetical protein